MKKLLFLSDFDGTMSSAEFYEYFITGPYRDRYEDLLGKAKNKEITSFEFMQNLFANIHITREQFDEYIARFPLHDDLKTTVEWVVSQGGDFSVISAGSSYYIVPILRKEGLQDIAVYANHGEFKNNNLHILPPAKEEFRCSYYGISKQAVAKSLMQDYELVVYAGDGTSDREAAKQADIRFARGALAQALEKDNTHYFPFTDFNDILQQLQGEFQKTIVSF
ncbi:MAG: MtnX-like HAD-IB family phosphatase [Fibrobacterota bacterium]